MHPYLMAALVYFGACYVLGLIRLLAFWDGSLGERLLVWVLSPINLPWCVLEPLLELVGEIASGLSDD